MTVVRTHHPIISSSGWAVVTQPSAVGGSDGLAFAPAAVAPNAWATRRETDSSKHELAGNDTVSAPPVFAQTAASRFAQASAKFHLADGSLDDL